MQRVALINGKNKNQDYDLSKIFSSIATSGIVDGLEVQNGKVTSGYAFIEVDRAGIKFNVLFQNTEDLVIDTTGTKKVFIEINQSNIDDGTINSSDGTGIGEIKTASSYPTKNFIALASINSGVITDARSFIRSKLLRKNLVANKIIYIDNNGNEILMDYGLSGQLLGSNGLTTPPSWQNVQSSITGEIRTWSTNFVPSGWLKCDGSAISRTTYSILFDTIVPNRGNPTISIATPGVLTLTAHGLNIGDSFYLTTTGSLPTGLSQNTLYYVIATGYTANSFQFSATRGGTAINTSGTQSGTHTLRACAYGLGDGSTTFNIPNLKGSVIVGNDTAQSEFLAVGQSGGAKTHTLQVSEIPSHSHTTTIGQDSNPTYSSSNPGKLGSSPNTPVSPSFTSSSVGGGGAHNNLQPYVVMNYIIKF